MQQAACSNHPTAPASAFCPDCGRPFCDSCLVEYLGERYCGPCRDRRLAAMTGTAPASPGASGPLAGTGTVDLGGWLNGGWETIKDDVMTFALASLVAVLLSAVSCGVLAGPMTCGLFMMAFRRMQGRPVQVGQVFDGFRRFLWAFLGLLLVGVGTALVSGILGLPADLIRALAKDQTALVVVATGYDWVMSTLVSIVVAGVTFFTFAHIAARNANPVEAVTASFQVFRRNPVMFSLTGWLYDIISTLGLIACCVGLFVTLPLAIAAQARAYVDHFGLEGTDL